MFIYVYVCLYVCFMSVGVCEARRGYPSAVAIVTHLTRVLGPKLGCSAKATSTSRTESSLPSPGLEYFKEH